MRGHWGDGEVKVPYRWDMAEQGTGKVLAPCHEKPPASAVSLGFSRFPYLAATPMLTPATTTWIRTFTRSNVWTVIHLYEIVYKLYDTWWLWLKLTIGPWFSLL